MTIARTDLRLMWRNPRRRIATLQGFMMPVVFGVIWFSDSRLSGTLLAMAPAICLAMIGVFGFTNVIAQDGRGIATIFLSPLDRADFFRGKALAFTAVTILPAAALCTIVALRVPLQPGVVAALLGAGAYMASIGTSASMSARFAIRQPDDDGKSRPPGASAAGWMFAFVQPVVVTAIFAPVWIPVLAGLVTHHHGVATAAAAAGLAYGGLVFHLAVRDAGRSLLAREHEMFQTLELGRTA